MLRADLEAYLDQYLEIASFRDYCPNGLQVEGRPSVETIVTGVTASAAMIEQAIAAGADALFVHHGYFWRGEDPRLTGVRRRRIGLLIEHDVNLFAYHLPLDAHADVGNNVALARELGWRVVGRFGEQDLGFHGETGETLTLQAFAKSLGERLAREPLVIGEPLREVRRVAWCTGAAQSYLEEAVRLGVDVFVSGEVSEQTVHLARESGVAFISAGHHATERYGIAALGAHLAARFGLAHRHIEVPNPV
jgi:dinuclear metal center YbgI/SA1388 family protein